MAARDLLIAEKKKRKELHEYLLALFLDNPSKPYFWYQAQVSRFLSKLFAPHPLHPKTAGNLVALILGAIVVDLASGSLWEDAVGKGIQAAAPKLDQVARTETVRSYNRSVIQDATGTLIWNAVLDSAICPECYDLDGTIFNIQTMAAPPLHPNCRCILEPE